MLNNQQTAVEIKHYLTHILGSDGINVLGQYQITDNYRKKTIVPSIKIDYQRDKNSVNTELFTKEIEVIIYPHPNTVTEKMSFANRLVKNFFAIILVQHNPLKSLDLAINEILKLRVLDIEEHPNRLPERPDVNGKGILPPQATLYHQQSQFLESI